jgi:hypothetical protein
MGGKADADVALSFLFRLIELPLTPKAILQRAEIAMTSIAPRSELELHRYLGKCVG